MRVSSSSRAINPLIREGNLIDSSGDDRMDKVCTRIYFFEIGTGRLIG